MEVNPSCRTAWRCARSTIGPSIPMLLAVRPDYRVEIHPKVLIEKDGPTLKHALQGIHGEPIVLPRHRAEHPDRDLLEERYERFLAAV
jgi:putative restriction endonuclease